MNPQGTGRAGLIPSDTLKAAQLLSVRLWCYRTARYGIVTQELISWLHERIAGRRAIEVCAGVGDLGFHLGIPMSDSAIQCDTEMILLYSLIGHATTDPPADVERLDALSAIAKHKPQVVIGSWVTQLYRPGDEGPPKIGSSIYGVDELALIESVETYIHIGNLKVHGDKRALALPHKVFEFPWLWSRAAEPSLNRIWVWGVS